LLYRLYCSTAFNEKAVRTVVDIYLVRYLGGKPSQSLYCSPGEQVYQIVNAGKRQSYSTSVRCRQKPKGNRF
jgi:hypothetical protein